MQLQSHSKLQLVEEEEEGSQSVTREGAMPHPARRGQSASRLTRPGSQPCTCISRCHPPPPLPPAQGEHAEGCPELGRCWSSHGDLGETRAASFWGGKDAPSPPSAVSCVSPQHCPLLRATPTCRTVPPSRSWCRGPASMGRSSQSQDTVGSGCPVASHSKRTVPLTVAVTSSTRSSVPPWMAGAAGSRWLRGCHNASIQCPPSLYSLNTSSS